MKGVAKGKGKGKGRDPCEERADGNTSPALKGWREGRAVKRANLVFLAQLDRASTF